MPGLFALDPAPRNRLMVLGYEEAIPLTRAVIASDNPAKSPTEEAITEPDGNH